MASHHLTVFGNEVTLDGRIIAVPAGANPHTIAVRAAKEMAQAEAKLGEAVHVTVRNDQGAFPLVITDGEVSAGPTDASLASSEAAPANTERPLAGAAEPFSSFAFGATAESALPAQTAEIPREEENEVRRRRHEETTTSLHAAWSTNADVRPLTRGRVPEQNPQPSPGRPTPPHAPVQPQVPAQAQPPAQAQAPAPPQPFAHTFIEKHRIEQAPNPQPVSGFAGVLAQFGIGGPSDAQKAEEADKMAISQVWTRPKGIAVANGKGGSGKTPTSLYLAAMFARFGGGMVLVDDNNTFRGAAGWQTENATHGATKEDLLAALPTFDGSERAADMARFTHHQTTDRYDVLQSRPQKLARDQAIDDAEFDAIQELLRRFYRVVVFDSGNDESAPNWLRMIHHSDVLVVPTATTPKHCESAKLLLEALTAQGGHSADLARNAVIVVSHASTNDPAPEQVAPRFAGMAREVLTIPHDPAMAREWLKWDDLAPKTQRAWLAVGAATARGMRD